MSTQKREYVQMGYQDHNHIHIASFCSMPVSKNLSFSLKWLCKTVRKYSELITIQMEVIIICPSSSDQLFISLDLIDWTQSELLLVHTRSEYSLNFQNQDIAHWRISYLCMFTVSVSRSEGESANI